MYTNSFISNYATGSSQYGAIYNYKAPERQISQTILVSEPNKAYDIGNRLRNNQNFSLRDSSAVDVEIAYEEEGNFSRDKIGSIADFSAPLFAQILSQDGAELEGLNGFLTGLSETDHALKNIITYEKMIEFSEIKFMPSGAKLFLDESR